MKDQMIWASLLQLSTNMWGDPGCREPFAVYRDEFYTDMKIWKDTVSFMPECGINTLVIDLGDAVRYESHPEIAVKNAWTVEELKTELDWIRSLGITPVPKLNFSTGHDAWLGEYSRMVSTKKYYEVCGDLIREVCSLFDSPELFHLGLDEEDFRNQRRYQLCIIRNSDLWWHDACFFFEECEKQGARPWVWADRYWNHPTEYLNKMPRSVMQSNWFYGRFEKQEDGKYNEIMIDTYEILDKAGFDQIPTSSTWGFTYNTRQTMEYGKELLSGEHLKGYMTVPWVFTAEEDRFALLNDCQRFWDARKRVYPETV